MHAFRLGFWLSPRGLATMGLIAATSYFLFTEHWAHTIAILPWLILLSCPVFHLFMHRGHGGHGSKAGADHDGPETGRGGA